MLEHLDILWQKMNFDLNLTSETNISPKGTPGINLKHKTRKILEKNIGEKFLDIEQGNKFLDLTSKA